MPKSLLFIPDISGFTKFVQTTEAEHSQHVIAELLEVLIEANTQQLRLAEVEGDALFFYKEGQVLSQEKLLAQIETMYTAFYSHLKLLEKNRICPCMACASAIHLELKIVAHVADLQFIEVQNNRKPFGEAVIKAHRLLKNSVESDNYVLLSKELATEIKMPLDYKSSLFSFRESVNTYDDFPVHYIYSEIAVNTLKLQPFQQGQTVNFLHAPNLQFERTFPINAEKLLEMITNYRHRHLWAEGADEIHYNENEVTRLDSEHMCVIGGKHFNFKVVSKPPKTNEIVYGEFTTSPPPVDALYQFFSIKPISENSATLTVELFWEARSIFKKIMIILLAKKGFKKNINASLDKLHEVIVSGII
ncbi:DUF2652 domain-containing protein [uncultured Dokdonia sp.]|uniref:DUF2652 domain-containing protein n=1 Tax=uncultured Dokdonia sp. TaxID=575653 RepID=UPI0026232318|nr:DUF2652 domain-containing protein [uncultured Dokdonia sp.]